MQYNYFGCTQDHIIQSFSDSVSADFASSGYSSSAVLTMELDYAEAEVSNKLSPRILRMFDKLEGVMPVEVVNVSGGTLFTLPFDADITKEVKGIYFYDIDNCSPSTVTSIGCVNDIGCNRKKCDGFNLTPLTFVDSLHVFYPSVLDPEEYDFYFDYSVDKSMLNLPSIALIIRAIVCCSVGSNLYSHEAEEWKRVTRFCENADKWLEAINDDWVPLEFKRIRFLKSILPQSVRSIPFHRS